MLLGKRKFFFMGISFFIFLVQVNLPKHVMATGNNQLLDFQLNKLLHTEQDLHGAIAGISVRSASNGQIIYEHFGDIRLRPASNLKLLTAASALSVLGENYTFPTEVLTDGKIKKEILIGNLFLKGKGDPTLLKTDFDKMAGQLEKMGIKKITGNVIGDDTWFDHTRFPLDLPWSDETTYYGAPISALTASPDTDFDAGTVVVKISPAKEIGSRPFVMVNPKSTAVKIVTKAKTVSADGEKKLKIQRLHDQNTIIIDGTLPIDSKTYKERISVKEPTRFALDLFYQSLKSHNIKVMGNLKTGKAPKKVKTLLIHRSIPLAQLVIPFMKLSNNGHAEILIKEMGRIEQGEGSWDKGISVFKNSLVKFGLNPKTMVLRDGSGVSHVDLIPANQLTQLLFKIQNETWFPSYIHSLPVAGEKDKMVGGTLRKRLQEPIFRRKIRAKTGSISTVSSLSGYVDTKTGGRLIFSILLNNLLNEEHGKKIEDKIVSILVNQ